MEGTATATTATSNMSMNCARQSTISSALDPVLPADVAACAFTATLVLQVRVPIRVPAHPSPNHHQSARGSSSPNRVYSHPGSVKPYSPASCPVEQASPVRARIFGSAVRAATARPM